MQSSFQHVDLGVLDVLEQLPRDVLRVSLWLELLVDYDEDFADDGLLSSHARAFRLVCHRSRDLSHQLIRRASLFCGSGADGSDRGAVVQANGAFLARLEALEDLNLRVSDAQDEDCSDAFIQTLRLGGAACRGVDILQLDTNSLLAAPVAEAVQRCCPKLCHLGLDLGALAGDFFLPLHSLSSLVKVRVESSTGDLSCGDVIRAVAALPSLRALVLQGHLNVVDQPLLASLTGLTRLCLRGVKVPEAALADAPAAGRALGRLTRLAKLTLPDWHFYHIEPDDDPQEAVSATMAQLSGLQGLSSLSVGNGNWVVTVTQDGVDALCRLTALTRLSCAVLAPRFQPGPGNLPLLRHFDLAGRQSSGQLAAMHRR